MNIKKPRVVDLFLLLIISLMWGSQFIFNKMALLSFTPVEIAMLRSIIGTMTLALVWFFFSKRNVGRSSYECSLDERSEIQDNFFKLHAMWFCVALFETTIPFLLIPWGQQYIDSAIAALLVGMIPIFVAVINMFLGQRIQRATIISITLGFLGVMVLLMPRLQGAHFLSHILGELAVLGGAFSFAISIFLIKKLPPVSAILSCRNILFWASIQLLPFFILTYSPHHAMPHLVCWLSVMMLGIFCAGIVYVCYVLLVNRAGVMIASFTNYLVPLIGFILGIVFFKEVVHLNFIIALSLIFIALFFGLTQKSS